MVHCGFTFRRHYFGLKIWGWGGRLCCIFAVACGLFLGAQGLPPGFPWDAPGKELTYQGRKPKRHGFSLWVRKMPWRAWQPVQYSCLENSMDRGAWQATVYRVAKSPDNWSDLARMRGLSLVVMLVWGASVVAAWATHPVLECFLALDDHQNGFALSGGVLPKWVLFPITLENLPHSFGAKRIASVLGGLFAFYICFSCRSWVTNFFIMISSGGIGRHDCIREKWENVNFLAEPCAIPWGPRRCLTYLLFPFLIARILTLPLKRNYLKSHGRNIFLCNFWVYF